MDYQSDDEFVLRLHLKQSNEELYLWKTTKSITPSTIVSGVASLGKYGSKLDKDDYFAMPILEFNV